ncbi:hypothetical protein C8F01DRAFT_1370487 [Mycena amicta]|nr:hypothetical protein C8F01DRAFT_1370487 [Mycena amicta]
MPPASKRKADEGASSTSRKRSKTKADFTAAKELVDEILEDDAEDGVGASDAKLLAEYIRALEDEIAAGSGQPKGKSSSEIKDAASKLRAACVSGIKKQMSWKPSCKTGSAKWSYDGVCTDPLVFARMLGLDSPPPWKMHKYSAEDFEKVMGSIESSSRYDDLVIMQNVTVRYAEKESTFKMSGAYGAPRHVNK